MDNIYNAGKVVILSVTDSFLAKSLITKLSGAGISAVFSHADIKEMDRVLPGTSLVILFIGEELEEMPETLVYLRDMVLDKDMGLMVISEGTEEEFVKKAFPEHAITEWFKRPLDIDLLVKKAGRFVDENTGEKRNKTVLIVDDDITYMRTVYEWLKGSYHVGMASSGVQAISYVAKNHVDLILLDYEMPVANGPQVLSMLKSDSETGQIPVMFLTGHGDVKSVLSVVGLSPVDYLLKTIDKETLLSKLDTYFKEHGK